MESEGNDSTRTRRIKSYKDLLVWQRAHSLVKKIFRLCRKLPKNRETDIISRQLIEAGTSIPANVAEGYGGHLGKGFAKYLEIARGSTTETDYWTYMLYDEKYISKDEYEDATKDCRELILMTNSMVNRIRGKVKS